MPDSKVCAQSMEEWFAIPQGEYVLSREQAYFDAAVTDIFGFNALQVGMETQPLLRNSRMPLRLRGGEMTEANIRFCFDEVPLACESIDLVVLPHVLEFADNPHQILREVERVLMPEGNLLISGFNPYSLWGMRRALGRKQGYPWCGDFIALKRLKDWLALLGFVVVGVSYTAHVPPFNLSSTLARCRGIEMKSERWWSRSGGVYFIHALKRVPGMRLIQPKWNKKLVGNLIPAAPKLNNNKSHKQK